MLQIELVKVDNITILLIILLLLLPLVKSLKKIKWGEFEAEIEPKEVKKVEREIKNLPESKKVEIIPYGIRNISNGVRSVLESDHILALAKLRIELEKLLNKILTVKEKQYTNKLGVWHIARILEKENIIDKSYIGPIKEVINLCNRAIHGEEIREKDAYSIVELGLDLLDKLSLEYYSLIIKPIEKIKITEKERDEYYDVKYEVTTVIPLAGEPYMNKYIFTQEELDQFLQGYEEHAEFLISIKKLDKK